MAFTRRGAATLVVFALVLTACGAASGDEAGAPNGENEGDALTVDRADEVPESAPEPHPHDAPTPVDRWEVYDPVRAGESLPTGYLPLLARDDILPVYEPRFVAGADVDWGADTLVIGVDLEGEARAYPVAFLTWREMVIDDHRGIPTLVTW